MAHICTCEHPQSDHGPWTGCSHDWKGVRAGDPTQEIPPRCGCLWDGGAEPEAYTPEIRGLAQGYADETKSPMLRVVLRSMQAEIDRLAAVPQALPKALSRQVEQWEADYDDYVEDYIRTARFYGGEIPNGYATDEYQSEYSTLLSNAAELRTVLGLAERPFVPDTRAYLQACERRPTERIEDRRKRLNCAQCPLRVALAPDCGLWPKCPEEDRQNGGEDATGS